MDTTRAAGDAALPGQIASPEPDKTIELSIPPTEKAGDRIGRYKLLQAIGEGGCGVVYMAEQSEPVRRRVALKVIKLGMDTRQVVARFEAERQALALMDHPNIAKVLDAGATDTGRPYFVMELVRGIRITEYCDKNNLPTPKRLELFVQVCRAIQHAHQRGIIHRDIKPSNILVTLHDGVPVPMVIDFGIAKATTGQTLTDKTLFTEFEQFIGTPAYMSPEQAEMSGLDIDTRSDIYSLGVLLYELLIGKTPFEARTLSQAGIDEMRRIIREQEPPRPSAKLSTLAAEDQTTTAKLRRTDPPKLVHLVRGDLDWIVMRCLEKDRTRRYDTVNALALDLEHHLKNEPVVARPPSQVYRLQKLVRRNKIAFAAGLIIVAVLLAAGAVTSYQIAVARKAQRQASLEAQRADENAAEKARRQQVEATSLSAFAWLSATSPLDKLRNGAVAVNLAERAAGLTHRKDGAVLDTLAAAYAEAGRFADAQRVEKEALALLRDERVKQDYNDRLKLYAANLPFRDSTTNFARFANSLMAPAGPVPTNTYAGVGAAAGGGPPPGTADSARLAVCLRERGKLYAQLGEWKQAATDLAEAVKLNPGDANDWDLLAPLLVQTGDLAGYDAQRHAMLTRYRRTTNPALVRKIVKACLLTPPPGADLRLATNLVTVALRGERTGPGWGWASFTAGLLEFRCGHFAEAADWMQQAVQTQGPEPTRDAGAAAVLAMAKHQLNQSDEANRFLTQGTKLAKDFPSPDNPEFSSAWQNVLATRILLAEARALVLESPAMPPN
jgi:serine/threonine protein kinase/tetratricopeptide (TPR) repeat protein